MAKQGAPSVLGGLGIALVAVVVFPWQWARSYRMAQRHTDVDPGGPARVVGAMVVGLVLAGALAGGLWMAHEAFQEGSYDTLDEQLQAAVREQEYQDAVATIQQRTDQIPIIEDNLENRTQQIDQEIATSLATADPQALDAVQQLWAAQQEAAQQVVQAAVAGGDRRAALEAYSEGDRIDQLTANWTQALESAGVHEDKVQELESAMGAALSLPDVLAQAHFDRHEAQQRAEQLEENHRFYLRIAEDIEAQRDEEVYEAIRAFSGTVGPDESIDMEVVESRFDRKDDAVQDMRLFFVYWPVIGWFSVIGFLVAPLVFVQGSILRRAWKPSETVGYRPYPSVSMGLFLLLGAFNIPALLFSAWAMSDIERRSIEGQISL